MRISPCSQGTDRDSWLDQEGRVEVRVWLEQEERVEAQVWMSVPEAEYIHDDHLHLPHLHSGQHINANNDSTELNNLLQCPVYTILLSLCP